MGTMSLNIDNNKMQRLSSIARSKGESPVELMNEIIDRYLSEAEACKEIKAIMSLSESSFSEWDNEDGAIYDKL